MQKNDEKALTNSKFSVTLKITKTINENVYYKLSYYNNTSSSFISRASSLVMFLTFPFPRFKLTT